MLDQVTDPHNLGAILRSAAAFGAIGIVTQDRHSPPESGVVAKAASGALERMPWVRVVNLARALEEIGEAGFWRIGLAGDAETELKDALGPAARRVGAGRRRAGAEAEHARALRRACEAADQRRRREPQRLQRRRGGALCRKHRLMVRTSTSIRAHVEALAAREPAFAASRSTSSACPSRAIASRARRRCCGPSSASRSASPRRGRCGPSSRLPTARRPTWTRLLTASDEELRAAGMSRQKAGYIRSLAQLVISGELDLGALPEDDEEAIALLTRIKGIGRWSAEIYLLFAEGRADIFPAGDLAVQIELGRLLGLPEKPSEKHLRELAEPWSPYRGAAAVLAWHSYNSSVL